MSGASFYEVYSTVTGSGIAANRLAIVNSSLSFTNTTPVRGTTIDYSLKACSPGGYSAFSAIDSGFITDGDNDGIADIWEIQFGLDPFDLSDAQLDKDTDGVINLEEFNAGTNPTINEAATIIPMSFKLFKLK